jgi:hypothetical protein
MGVSTGIGSHGASDFVDSTDRAAQLVGQADLTCFVRGAREYDEL